MSKRKYTHLCWNRLSAQNTQRTDVMPTLHRRETDAYFLVLFHKVLHPKFIGNWRSINGVHFVIQCLCKHTFKSSAAIASLRRFKRP